MKKKGFNFSFAFGVIMLILAVVCIIRFFVLLGGAG